MATQNRAPRIQSAIKFTDRTLRALPCPPLASASSTPTPK